LLIVSAHIFFLDILSIFFLLHLGLISTLYNVPEKKRGVGILPLRSLPILKVFLISYVWTSISSFFPALIESIPLVSNQILLIFIGHFMFITSITLPFDIRDFNSDNKNSLITFPQLIGIQKTKYLALACLVIFTILTLRIINFTYILPLSLIVGFLIIKSGPSKKGYYYTLYLDGCIILYFMVVILSLNFS